MNTVWLTVSMVKAGGAALTVNNESSTRVVGRGTFIVVIKRTDTNTTVVLRFKEGHFTHLVNFPRAALISNWESRSSQTRWIMVSIWCAQVSIGSSIVIENNSSAVT